MTSTRVEVVVECARNTFETFFLARRNAIQGLAVNTQFTRETNDCRPSLAARQQNGRESDHAGN
jgi:hypothetical protein